MDLRRVHPACAPRRRDAGSDGALIDARVRMAGEEIATSSCPFSVVREADLERELALLCEAMADAPAGAFGPGSMVWRIDKEAAIFLGAGRALLLQLAHPWIAAAIAQHSRTLTDPIG